RTILEGLTFSAPRIPVVSNLTGELVEEYSPEYWVRHVREAVRFHDGVQTLTGRGVTRFVELGPGGVLSAMIDGAVEDVVAIPTLRKDRDEPTAFMTAVATAHTYGVEVDWEAVFAGTGARRIDLPTYAFQHKWYWLEGVDTGEVSTPVSAVDAEFWAAVERQDPELLARTLDVAADAPLNGVLPVLAEWRRRRTEESTLDSWRYRVVWEPRPEPVAPSLNGTWLLLAEAGDPVADDVAHALRAHGADVVTATKPQERPDGPLSGVVSLLGMAEDPHPEHPAIPSGVAATVALVAEGIDAPLWLLTKGGVAVGAAEELVSPAQAQVWAVGRVAALEHAERWGGLVDLPATLDARAGSRLAAVLAGLDDEDQVAVRSSGVYVRRIVPAPRGEVATEWTTSGTALVTGGTGALGAHVARWLARNGAEHLVLTSRSGSTAKGVPELVAELEALGVTVSVEACDVADRDALARLVAALDAAGRPVRSVVHCAGVLRLSAIVDLSLDEFAEVAGAKALGATNLDAVFADRELDAFVLFSSVAGVWGSGWHAAYAAANAHLDAVALRRRAAGLTATAIGWGPWAGGGMAAEDELRRRGLHSMDPESALAALQRALGEGLDTLAVAEMDWERFIPGFTSARRRPLLEGIPEVARIVAAAPQKAVDADAGSADALRAELAGLPDLEQRRVLTQLVCRRVAEVLGHASAAAVEPEQAFSDLGFDSLTSVELRNRLLADTGMRLPATLVFDYPTPVALAAHLLDRIAPTEDVAATVLADLDALRPKLTSAATDELTRMEIELRLRDLLAALDTEQQATRSAGPRGGDDEDLESATAEELFDVLDKQFGS
ncbi:SDR family NAD(P)-dependent oxidoreductase, partial [Saccharomonospora azurea]|uniref:SDR family NAD(P)-dependent oxidoreductase n=1 Tax=Saccharomonospora azurea TaxID=40988 RepID=UPI0024097302